jgi:Tfp pilus assembly protein PilZ
MNERRQSKRRSLPFVRRAILEVGPDSHIVLLSDLSTEGAFLTTHRPFPIKKGQALRLRMVIPRASRKVAIPCELVWINEKFDAATGRPSGMAVRFLELDADMHRRVEEFAVEGFRPSAAPTPIDHYEHRIIERSTVDVTDLNRFGKDGWSLVTIVPSERGFKLILVRRL